MCILFPYVMPNKVVPLSLEDLVKIVEEKLKNGWVIVQGDPECIMQLEYNIYPPGTKENANFELVVIGGLPVITIFFAKKTEKLREFLMRCGLSEEEFNKLLVLTFYKITQNSKETICLTHALGATNSIDEAISKIVNKVKKILNIS